MKNFFVVCLSFLLVSCFSNSNDPVPVAAAPVEKPGVNGEGKKTEPKKPQPEAVKKEVIQLNGATATQITLKNNLKVTLISSPTSKKASASMAVGVGHVENPVEHQGMAHFVEHMLFLGTDEYPDEESYKKFVNQNGGSSNAYTSTTHTNYFFDVAANKFDEGLHRFSRFFVTPTFNEEFVEKEKTIIQNEFEFRKEAFKPGRVHDAFLESDSKSRLFSIGNNASLEDATPDHAREFFEEHYFAEAMHGVLTGPQSLEELEVLAEKYFSDIKSEPQRALNTREAYFRYDFDQLPAKVLMKPQGIDRVLTLTVPLSSPKEEPKKLLYVLRNILGDESQQSLMWFLQQKGLLKPGAGAISGSAGSSSLTVYLDLSEQGLTAVDQIIGYVKGYTEFLKETDFPEFINDEIQKRADAELIRRSYFDVSGGDAQTVNRIFFMDNGYQPTLKEIFFGRKYPSAQKEDYFDYLKRLDWSKILVVVKNPDHQEAPQPLKPKEHLGEGGLKVVADSGNRVLADSIFLYSYEVQTPAVDKIQSTGKQNHVMIFKNPFVPQAFQTFSENEASDFAKKDFEGGFVYETLVPGNPLPYVFFDLTLHSDKVNFDNPSEVASLFLMREWMRLQMASYDYTLSLAGFKVDFPVYTSGGAIGVSINGWNDTFLKALGQVLTSIQFKIESKDFETLKKLYTQKIKQERAGDVWDIGSREMRSQYRNTVLSYEVLFDALEGIDINSFQKFMTSFTSSVHFRGVMSGNYPADTLNQSVKMMEEKWGFKWAPQAAWAELHELETELGVKKNGELQAFETTIEGNHPQESLYRGLWNFGTAKSKKEILLNEILGQWLQPDYYTELRSNRKMAYSLYAGGFELDKQFGLFFYLQSSTFTVDEVETIVDEYLVEWSKTLLPQKSQSDLDSVKAAIRLKRERPVEIGDIHDQYFDLMIDGYSSYDEYLAELDDLDSITLKEVKDFGQKSMALDKKGAFVKVTRKK